MKIHLLLAAIPALAACGGGSKDARAPEPIAEAPAPEPEEPPPPPPMQWRATAALTPVKGSRMKPGEVTFEQTEGEATKVVSAGPLEGIRAGTYHLVIHEGAACGSTGTKAGPGWPKGAPLSVVLEVAKGEPGTVDLSSSEIVLDGEQSVVGRTLVIHEDRNGKLGRAVACGPITRTEGSPEGGQDAEPALEE